MAARKTSREDPVKKLKSVAKNVLDGVFDDLVQKNVLNDKELQRLGKDVNVIVNRTEDLVKDIVEKTQEAGKIFMDHFCNPKNKPNLKCEDEKENTELAGKTWSAQMLALPPTAPLETNDKMRLCPPNHFQKMKTEKANEIYPVMEKEGWTRLALIICNKEFDHLSPRDGAEIDVLGMQDLLEDLGYLVVVKHNLSAQEMERELKQFAARPEHKSSDSTFLVFMSHGVLDGICGKKHSSEQPDILNDDTIFRIFNNRNCQNLKDKPKIILMQACRGVSDGTVWMTDMGEAPAHICQPLQCSSQYDAITKAHVEKDFIAFKASTPHNVSWRLETNGSLFISQLISYFKKYSCCYHLEEIFRKVQHSFETPSELTQMPTIERVSMTRYFYLFPGN